MLAHDTFKAVDTKFKAERNPLDKTPFSYTFQGQEQSLMTSLSQYPMIDIAIDAIPKITNLKVLENGNLVLDIKIATTLFKKTAR